VSVRIIRNMVSKFDDKIATFAARTKNTIILH
jgi:hypothetical protein